MSYSISAEGQPECSRISFDIWSAVSYKLSISFASEPFSSPADHLFQSKLRSSLHSKFHPDSKSREISWEIRSSPRWNARGRWSQFNVRHGEFVTEFSCAYFWTTSPICLELCEKPFGLCLPRKPVRFHLKTIIFPWNSNPINPWSSFQCISRRHLSPEYPRFCPDVRHFSVRVNVPFTNDLN